MRRAQYLGSYQLLQQISSGGMAEIYLGKKEGRLCAIKRILPRWRTDQAFLLMLIDEARILRRLHHPHLIALETLEWVEGQHILVMPYIDGVDLRSLLKRLPTPRDPEAIAALSWVIERSLWGLDAAHRATDERGQPLALVHQDLSPANLLLGYDGCVKLSDFGVAQSRLTRNIPGRASTIYGKLNYISPEQAAGHTADLRADIFSMGAVLYRCLTGHHAFHAFNLNQRAGLLRDSAFRAARTLNTALNAEIDDILAQALGGRPEARYASAAAFAGQLRHWRRAHWPYSEQRLSAWLRGLFAADRAEHARMLEEYAGSPASALRSAPATLSRTDRREGTPPTHNGALHAQHQEHTAATEDSAGTRALTPESSSPESAHHTLRELDHWLKQRRRSTMDPAEALRDATV